MTRKASAKVTPTVPGRRESKQASSNATASATASASSRGRSSTADKRKDLRRPLSSQASKDIDGTSTVRIPASGAKSVVAEEGLGPFLVVSQDVGGLLVSSFLVPSVRFPFRGVPAWVATVLLQIGLIIYIAVYLNTKEGFGPCSTPAVLQVLAIYVFLLRSVTSASDSVGLFQVAAKCMRVRHELEMKIIPARKLTRRCRISLVMVPVIDFLVEITTFIVGAIMLLNSSSILDCVLNSLALSFISEIDTIALRALIIKASRHRLCKYSFEHVIGLEDGISSMAQAGVWSKRLVATQWTWPWILLAVTLIIVVLGQCWGRYWNPIPRAQGCTANCTTLQCTVFTV